MNSQVVGVRVCWCNMNATKCLSDKETRPSLRLTFTALLPFRCLGLLSEGNLVRSYNFSISFVFNTLATSPFFDWISMQIWKRIIMYNHLESTTPTFQIFAPSPQHRRPPRQSRLWKPTLCPGSLFPGNQYTGWFFYWSVLKMTKYEEKLKYLNWSAHCSSRKILSVKPQ